MAIASETSEGPPGDPSVIVLESHTLNAADLDACLQWARAPRGSRLVVDFRNVRAVLSEAFGRLVTIRKLLTAQNATMAIRGLDPDLRDVFRMIRLDQVFEIE